MTKLREYSTKGRAAWSRAGRLVNIRDGRRRGRGRGRRSVVATALAVAITATSGAAALAYASSSGWVDGYGRAIGTGYGLVLPEFYSVGANATYRQKWLGAYNASVVSSNTPAAAGGEVWCIESGEGLNSGYAYSWSTSTNVRARYLMWLSRTTWNSADGRAAIQYLLYADAFPGLGQNNTGGSFDYESRIWNHADFTAGARSLVNSFRTLSTSQMYNTPATMRAEILPGTPTNGLLDGIGVRDAWGSYVSGINYTITITGDAVFDSTGTKTVTGTTAASQRNDAHPWHATGAGDASFTITYLNAGPGGSVYIGSGGGVQDVLAFAGFANLTFEDPISDMSVAFQPAGVTQVPSSTVSAGDVLVDVFTPAATADFPWAWTDQGDYVPATYTWALYEVGSAPPLAPSPTLPASWTLLEEIEVTVTEPNVPITSTFTSTAEAGKAYAFVVSFVAADQPAEWQDAFIGDWSDAYGADTETVFSPVTATATSVASFEERSGETVLLDEVVLTGFPADHGAFTGSAVFAPDVTTVAQRLHFFPEGLAVTDANLPAADLICDVTIPATNGVHMVDEACATARKDAWGQLEAGTYVWTSVFPGDGRVEAFATSATDTAEQVPFVNDPLAVVTTARASNPGLQMDVDSDVWDEATVSGFVPVGSTIEFDLYLFADASAPVCDATTHVVNLAPTTPLAGAGTYTSERHTMTMPNTAALGFVATVYAPDGSILEQGQCGEATETLSIARGDGTGDDVTTDFVVMAHTGADGWQPWAAAAAVFGTIGAALLVWSRGRVRQTRQVQ